MAETKTSISELTAATSVASGDLLLVSQQSGGNWASRKATAGQLSSAIGLSSYLKKSGDSTLSLNDSSYSSLYVGTQNSYIYIHCAEGLGPYFEADSKYFMFPSSGGTFVVDSALAQYVLSSRQVAGKKLSADVTAADISSAISLSNYSLTSHTHSGYVPTSRQVAGYKLSADVTAANLSSAIGLSNYTPTSRKVAGQALTADVTASTISAAISLSNYSLTSHTHTGYIAKSELATAIASVGQIPSGDNANLSSTISKFNSLISQLSALAT